MLPGRQPSQTFCVRLDPLDTVRTSASRALTAVFARSRLTHAGSNGFGRARTAARRQQGESPVIEVQHLTKRYGRFTAVDDVSFRVDKGEILGFLGPNGAGKTTTMRILTGYMPATTGKAVVAGFDVFDQPLEAKRRTGYLPETPPLYPDMTVRDYLLFVARIKGVASQGAARPGRHGDGEDARRRRGHAGTAASSRRATAARRAGPGDPAQPRGADPRRADRRPRPEADHGDPRPDQGSRRLATRSS